MALIHRTTMRPTKLELLADWLPTRAWYAAGPGAPRPVKAGGFRLDDPEGEVGVEFMVVTDGEGPDAGAYLVPMTYRGKPLDGAGHALIGTSEHGVLGTRWIYDGAHDPVLVRELYALLVGRAVPQQQSVSDAADPTVAAFLDTAAAATGNAEPVEAVDGAAHTDIRVRVGDEAEPLTLRLRRVLRPAAEDGADAALGGVTAEWTPAGPDAGPASAPVRGAYVTVHRP
ncbi:1,4-alpha-glucan branching protein [Streptomyces sp. R302]|uniref:maltokinase N-terminal cap-like domain-containing protein n=1 Tax=unclassified Streptomyces TaxID=2593676 RepID=UPI00145E6B62|nr:MULTISPECIES: 1,4-alpha-glucan branching protein [unclassified Streptomyces]NML51025.1 1,4-alpha-glucan branching protein [Streptomyces sp. R301]NML81119.1 1,4-alpha-glucan branching protein [Streptomyces sp. R302]